MQTRIAVGLSSAIVAVAFVVCSTVVGAETRSVTLARYTTINPYEDTEYGGEPYVYMCAEDTTLVYKRPAFCYGGAGTLQLGAGSPDTLLIAFKSLNRAIYRASTVKDATLVLHVVPTHFKPEGELRVYRVLASWRDGGEADRELYWAANYVNRYHGPAGQAIRWAAPGAKRPGIDRAAEPSLVVKVADAYDAEKGTLTLSGGKLAEDVQYWAERHYLNYGWLIEQADPAAMNVQHFFYSGEAFRAELRPALTITYDTPASTARPQGVDLDVTYIERTPRYLRYLDEGTGQYEVKEFRGVGVGVMKYPKYGSARKWPRQGETVTFTAHVKNAGTKEFVGVIPYEWRFNERVIMQGTWQGRLKPGEEATVEYEWAWQIDHSDHRDLVLAFWADPGERIADTCRNNNALGKYVEGRTLKYWVDQQSYDYINSQCNAWGSYSFEDYLQWHWWIWNETYLDKSRFAEIARDGCLERVSLDAIEVVPNGLLDPWGKHTPKPTLESPAGTGLADCRFDGEWGSCWPWDTKAKDYDEQVKNVKRFFTTRTVLLEGSLLHECSHQCLAAFDVYWSNIEPSDPSEPNGKCKVKDGGEYYITRGDMYPFSGLMGGGDTRPDARYRLNTGLFSLHSIAGFNSNLPYRAGFFGEWQYDLPRQIYVRVLDAGGRPISGASVKIWQAVSNAITDENVVAANVRTTTLGYLPLPVQDSGEATDITTATGHTLLKRNPFGRINVVGTNTTLLLRVEAYNQRDYGFVRLVRLNEGYWRGEHDRSVATLYTSIVPSAQVDWQTNVARDCTVTATTGQDTVAKAVDGDVTTEWNGGRTKRGDSVQLDLGKSVPIAAVRLVKSGAHDAFYTYFRIDVSDDPEFKTSKLFAAPQATTFGYAMGCFKDVDPEQPNVRWVTYANAPTMGRYIR
ncbi:MAG: discoidin domain-containing protein, partial [Verrucomicrobia bacterium]|nr:discoidin domain-containing protein [Verrucomicrobiota bacterium]